MALAAKQNGVHLDDVSEAVSRAVSGVEGIKVERDRLRQLLTDSDKAGAMKDGELTAMGRNLANERYMRSFYQNYAATVANSLNTIMAVVDEAFRAGQAAAQQEAENERAHGRADLPTIEIPAFMQRWQDENKDRQS